MITSRQRSFLRGLANKMEVSLSVGKGGASENVYKQADNLLESRELIKITVFSACEFSAKEIINIFCEKLNAEPVQAIGSKFVIYRKSSREDVKHIEI